MATIPRRIVEELSFVPLHIQIRFGETELGIGTGFIYRHGEKNWLITNWHNVSGRHPSDHHLISTNVAIPDNLLVRIPSENTDPEGQAYRKWTPTPISLYKNDDQTTPEWVEHPIHGSAVDVVAILIEGAEGTAILAANADKLGLANLKLYPGMDAFILGYPRGLSAGGRLPIWKRGSLASEPDVNIDELPMMYIDSATREGMSGAPVYAKETGFWAPEGKELPADGVLGRGHRFIGVYSGRILAGDPFLAQLGIVWKEEAIKEVIVGNKAGVSSFQLSHK